MALDVTGNIMTIQVNRKTEVISTDESVNVTKSETADTTTFDLAVNPSASHWVDGEADGSVRTTTSTPESEEYHLGEGAVAEGHNTKAIGRNTHAEGEDTEAFGECSHAEGLNTYADEFSHAEGIDTVAIGNRSLSHSAHAEGQGRCESVNLTYAGTHAHYTTEGDKRELYSYTKVKGAIIDNHIYFLDGYATYDSTTNSTLFVFIDYEDTLPDADVIATLFCSYAREAHTEGICCTAEYNGHAEGEGCFADARGHAEGHYAYAESQSHAEGTNTIALSESHAEGVFSMALGADCHTEGYQTIAMNMHSHAEGTGFFRTSKSYNVISQNGYTLVLEGNVEEDFVYVGCLASPGGNQKDFLAVHSVTYDSDNNQSTVVLSRLRPYELFNDIPDNVTAVAFVVTGAYGQSAHSEGTGTWAQSHDSHTEGYETIALNKEEHASGRLNLPVKEDIQNNIPGTLFTVGNGYYDEQHRPVRKNAFRVDRNGAIYAPQIKQGAGTLKNVCIDENGQIVYVEGAGGNMTEVTASELRTLVANSGLTAGSFYRITDYQCTSNEFSNMQNATNQFDIVLLALDESTLEKKGWAMKHAGDTYFANADLSQWQVWFDLALDTYGRVLRLIDDRRNECFYDFKNIKWLLSDDKYHYTFSYESYDKDFSILYFYNYPCKDNKFGTECHHNVFKIYEDGGGCSYNTFGSRCNNNILSSGCFCNTFGDDCYSNTFGNACSYNTFGDDCYSNTFGHSCGSNTFGNSCGSNTFGNYCKSNTFGNYCKSNTFGNSCSGNTFGNYCKSNTFGNYCSSNTFGNFCIYIKFGNSSDTRNYYRHIRIDNGNQYIYLDCTGTLSSSSYYQNVHIGLGVNNTTTWKTITDSNVNQNYQTEYLPTNSVTINV